MSAYRLNFPVRRLVLLALWSGAAASAWAQFKVVGPDGRITYTDRPPQAEPAAKVSALKTGSGAGDLSANSSLPPELRQASQRFPVTLYTAADCAPCDAGRQMLAQRGVPYAEKRASSEDDGQAMERITGGRTVPVLSVGSQMLRGHNPSEWANYLDAAGYPKESRLPKGWQAPAATALVAKVEPKPVAPAAPKAPQRPAPETPVERPAGIRF
jgi:glutaredoxin